MKIYIIRHGETKANEESRVQGWTDGQLNENGRRLAVLTGQGMKGIKFDIAFSSHLSRAKETAEIILRETGNEGVRIVIDDRLIEMNMGELEGDNFVHSKNKGVQELFKQYFINPYHMERFKGGENVHDVMKRTQECLIDIARMDYENVLIATHGGSVRCMLNFLYDNPEDFWHGHVPYNCAVNIVEVNDGKLKLIADDKIYYDASLCVDRYAMKK